MSSETSRSDASRFRLDIQGLRAIAVGLVLLYHAGVPLLSGGFVGVDVFFVISGYLITSHLLRSLQRDGRIGFADFYARRARRILPASFVVLVLTVIGSLLWLPPLQLRAMLQGAVATALYVPNYFFAAIGTSYLSDKTPSLFQHYWSLGVEEQFYLVWPAVLALGFLLFRRSRRAVLVLVAALVVFSLVFCIVLTPLNQPWAFFSLPTRAWELGAGGLVAFLMTSGAAWLSRRGVAVLGWIGLAGLVVTALLFTDQTPFPSSYAVLPVVSSALVIIGGGAEAFSPRRILSFRPLVFIGTISYSLYLVHWPALLLAQAAVGQRDVLPLGVSFGIVVACIPVAWLLYRFVETPFRNPVWLARFRPRRTFVLTAVASVAIAAACGAGISAVGTIPLHTNETAAAYRVTTDPSGTTFVPENLTPSLADAKDSVPETSDNGCHLDFTQTSSAGCQFGSPGTPTVAIFGDSHAEQWFPPLRALADRGLITVDTNTKSSCNSVDVVSTLNNEPYPVCDAWRASVIQRFRADPPDVIILANFARENDVDLEGEPFDSYWRNGLTQTISELPAASKVIVLGETATMGISPAICLSAHLDDADYCGRPPAEAIDTASLAAEREAAEAASAQFLDMNPYLCSASWCPPIIGDVLVYSDDHHLTVPFTTALASVVLDAVNRALASE